MAIGFFGGLEAVDPRRDEDSIACRKAVDFIIEVGALDQQLSRG